MKLPYPHEIVTRWWDSAWHALEHTRNDRPCLGYGMGELYLESLSGYQELDGAWHVEIGIGSGTGLPERLAPLADWSALHLPAA
jgi:hypothetical protein